MRNRIRCWAEVSLDALRENLAWIRHRVGPSVKVMTVVKADAYGHGLRQIAAHLMRNGTDVFGVANLAEARIVRSVGQGWPILMLGACLEEEMHDAVVDGVMPSVSTQEEVVKFAELARQQGRKVLLHVKVDTGMGRLGVQPAHALSLIQLIQSLPGVAVEGLFTHYASVEDDPEFSRFQRESFLKLVEEVQQAGIQVPMIHANNSGGLLHEPDSLCSLVRPGLLVYGIAPDGQRLPIGELDQQIRPALSLKCRVAMVKPVEPGRSLSYGRSFTAIKPMKVATLTAGYGDGYLRAGSNRASVLVSGRRCPVVGRITMDQMLVDVTDCPEAAVGAEAVLLGSQGSDTITANEVAAWCDTIPWEVLTSISYRVPRHYQGGHAA